MRAGLRAARVARTFVVCRNLLDCRSAPLLDALVGTGRYGPESEVVEVALRLLSSREARTARLRQSWRESVEGGNYQPAEIVFGELEERYRTPDSDA
ncbi:type II toxin-antitoxin system ParD family antitoxin [Methylobacterium currus]|uniref:ribbon-helix-helix domain-containing protein n=1 Tax=Methylobacterium currus TaxID=2051553 RepID=UPI0022AA420A|nr:type II toxin-antitoxin system ParD family antitoxin [Methylobacterium currus]